MTKPDCTGERFGLLVVLGKGSRRPYKNTFMQLWKLQCDCGRIIEKPRSDFEHGRQVSCGCSPGDRGKNYKDITGFKFGTLTALSLAGKKDASDRPTWKMQCDCGNIIELSLSTIRHNQYFSVKINCRDRTLHPERWLHYPPAPSPYPKEAGELVVKYLYLTEVNSRNITDAAVEDELRKVLLRTAWIITYRRSQGEYFTESREKNHIRKSLRFCPITVFWQRKLECMGRILYNPDGKKHIGSAMTNTTSLDYPEIETQGINFMSANISKKRLKFRRC
jgi:hypothetical protein